ncbi:MAG: HypC/HybG/HupF family hydrogenase formation chaperone [Candidatus Hydrogenedentota bacterium]|nr:MAG: HypC/HybG/HupF family hydrogenase formation chaperone [Candidatus Hydrogenedentota bacterium]
MCLALPGRVTAIMGDDPMMRIGKVAFSGVITEVNLCFVPDAKVGDYVLVHAGFAITTLDETAAARTFEYLHQERASTLLPES